MICEGVEHVKGKTRHVLNLGVGRAIVTLGAVLVAEETGHALASELPVLIKRKNELKINSRESGFSVSTVGICTAIVQTQCALVTHTSTILIHVIGVIVTSTLE